MHATMQAPDAVGHILMLPPEKGGRHKDAHNGYRPHVEVRPGVVTSAELEFIPQGTAKPGDSTEVRMRFFFPDLVHRSLWAGKQVRVREGSQQVAEIVLDRVLNPLLDIQRDVGLRPADAESEAWSWSQWDGATGGYGHPYDPRPVFRELGRSPRSQPLWDELWSALHHQGDIGSASLLAVPLIAWVLARSPVPDWNPLALFCTIEAARLRTPHLWPNSLHFSRYTSAVTSMAASALSRLALDDEPLFVIAALATVAYDRGLPNYAGLLAELTSDEAVEVLREHRGA